MPNLIWSLLENDAIIQLVVAGLGLLVGRIALVVRAKIEDERRAATLVRVVEAAIAEVRDEFTSALDQPPTKDDKRTARQLATKKTLERIPTEFRVSREEAQAEVSRVYRSLKAKGIV